MKHVDMKQDLPQIISDIVTGPVKSHPHNRHFIFVVETDDISQEIQHIITNILIEHDVVITHNNVYGIFTETNDAFIVMSASWDKWDTRLKDNMITSSFIHLPPNIRSQNMDAYSTIVHGEFNYRKLHNRPNTLYNQFIWWCHQTLIIIKRNIR